VEVNGLSGEKELLVSKIRDGTVIDHISAGKALKVLRILGITGGEGFRVAIVMNADSRKLGRKDIIKLENKYLSKKEVDLIALVAPTATINIIRDYDVVEKYNDSLPEEITGLIKCPNPNCITRKPREVALSRFRLLRKEPVVLECCYCGARVPGEDVEKYLEA